MTKISHGGLGAAVVLLGLALAASPTPAQSVFDWPFEFPRTNYAQRSILFNEIVSDGAVRDLYPAHQRPAVHAGGGGDGYR